MENIPPKNEWRDLSIQQLYDLKFKLQDVFLGLTRSGASFANQYASFVSEVERLIELKNAEAAAERDQE